MTKKRVYRAGGIFGWKTETEKKEEAAKKAAEEEAAKKAEAEAAKKTAFEAALKKEAAVEKAGSGVKDQISRFSRTTLPFMRFLYDGSEVSDSELQTAYKADKELNAYKITSIDAVTPIDLEMFKKYLGVFLQFMIDELVDVTDEIRTGVSEDIIRTGFAREEVEFEAFLNAVDAIRKKPAEERTAALPEALFEAFSKLKDTKYVMLIPESFTVGSDRGKALPESYTKINATGAVKPDLGRATINGLNCMYLWKLLSRNYSEFYSVIIDKMFTGSGKITFEDFIAKYNEWTLKKTAEMKDSDKISKTMSKVSRIYLMPFEKIEMREYKRVWGYNRYQEGFGIIEDKITVQEIE
jgi:hypothetical protein